MLKRSIVIAVLILVSSIFVAAQTKAKRTVPAKPRVVNAVIATPVNVEAQLKKLETEWFKAIIKHDATTLNRIIADDFSSLQKDGTFLTKAEMVKIMSSVKRVLDEIRPVEFNMRLYGNTAVVDGRAAYIKDGKPLGEDGHTCVWVNRNGAWQVVSWLSTQHIKRNDAANNENMETPAKGELKIEDMVEGIGVSPKPGQQVTVHYTGWLEDGTKFDSSVDTGKPFTFTIGVGQVIKGWDQGVMSMKKGGKRKLIIPPHLGYGSRDIGAIPPNSTLIFEVELLDVK